MGSHFKAFWIILPLTALALWSCTGAGGGGESGPQAWIDYPPNNAVLPLEPVSILAHASFTGGVDRIEFFVDGEEVNTVGVGGGRLESASIEWRPLGPGRYRIEARGVDAGGGQGAPAAAVVIVGELSGAGAETPKQTATSTTTLTVTGTGTTPTVTVTPTGTQPTLTSTPETPQPPGEPSVTADTDANCRYGPSTLFDVYGYLLAGQSAGLSGRLADNSWFLVTLPGKTEECYVSASVVSVVGELGAVPVVQPPPPPITDTPTPTFTPTYTPTTQVPDTTPPTVISATFNPTTIMKEGPGCPGYSRTAILTVRAQDNVAISSVIANWVLRDTSNAEVASGSINLNFSGGDSYQVTFGPFNSDGTLYVNGTVKDTSGNTSPFSQQITVLACIE